LGAGKLDGGGDAAAGGRIGIGDGFGGAAGVGGGGTATGGEGGGTTAAGTGGGEATTTGGGGTASGGGGGKEGGGEVSCGGGVDAEGRGGGAAGDEGGSAGVALGCVTGAGEASVGVVVTGDGVAVEGGKVALMVPGEGEGDDAIGAQQQARKHYSAVTVELLPWWWNWRKEAWHMPQFKEKSSQSRGFAQRPIEIPPLSFLLPPGGEEERGGGEISHLEHRERSFSLKSARTALVPREGEAAEEDGIPKEQQNLWGGRYQD